MSFRKPKRLLKQFGRSSLAVLLIGLVLFLGAMASSEALHKLVHADADAADHHCAASLFAHGQVESATGDLPAAVPTVLIEAAPRIEFSVFSPAIENLPAERAPPAAVSSLV